MPDRPLIRWLATPGVIVLTALAVACGGGPAPPTETPQTVERDITTPTPAVPTLAAEAPTPFIATPTYLLPTPVPSEETYLSPQPEPGIVPTPTRYLPEGGVAPESIEAIQEEMRAIERDCPIAQLLPYGGPFDNQPFFIDSPTRERVIWISIDEASDPEEAKKAALGWIQGQGYDPENLGCEIRFEIVGFPN